MFFIAQYLLCKCKLIAKDNGVELNLQLGGLRQRCFNWGPRVPPQHVQNCRKLIFYRRVNPPWCKKTLSKIHFIIITHSSLRDVLVYYEGVHVHSLALGAYFHYRQYRGDHLKMGPPEILPVSCLARARCVLVHWQTATKGKLCVAFHNSTLVFIIR